MAEKIKVGIWGLGRAGNGMHAGEIARYPEMFEVDSNCSISSKLIGLYQGNAVQSSTYYDNTEGKTIVKLGLFGQKDNSVQINP